MRTRKPRAPQGRTKREGKRQEHAHCAHVVPTALGDAHRPVSRVDARTMLAQLTGGCELCEITLLSVANRLNAPTASLVVTLVRAAGIRGASRCLTSPDILVFAERYIPVHGRIVRWAGHIARCRACSTVLLGEFGIATQCDRRDRLLAERDTDALLGVLASTPHSRINDFVEDIEQSLE